MPATGPEGNRPDDPPGDRHEADRRERLPFLLQIRFQFGHQLLPPRCERDQLVDSVRFRFPPFRLESEGGGVAKRTVVMVDAKGLFAVVSLPAPPFPVGVLPLEQAEPFHQA